jgi:hypothetical protein
MHELLLSGKQKNTDERMIIEGLAIIQPYSSGKNLGDRNKNKASNTIIIIMIIIVIY